MTTALVITCLCGRVERYDGELADAVAIAQASARWHTDTRGFFVCVECMEGRADDQHAA